MGCLRLTHDVETSFSADAPLAVVYRKREVGQKAGCVLGEVCGNGQQNQGNAFPLPWEIPLDEVTVDTRKDGSNKNIRVNEEDFIINEIPNYGLLGDITGINSLIQLQSEAIDIYGAEGINAYIYFQIGIAHQSEMGGISGARNKGGVGLSRVFTSQKKHFRRPQTVLISGQNRIVRTGPQGGKFYINKNGNRVRLNRDGTKPW